MKCLLLLMCFYSAGALSAIAVVKPVGIFASSGALDDGIYAHAENRGVLIRAYWSHIEPVPGEFDFSVIDRQVAQVESNGKPWSLAISAGGTGSPSWLIDSLGAGYQAYTFRGEPGYRLPLIWDARVQTRMGMLAEALGTQFAGNESLALVYIPQMTSNGIEGHLQGVDMAAFKSAGFTGERWVDGSLAVAGAFAAAFPEKALAFEVHDVDGGAEIPETIIHALWDDPDLGQRVGAAIWWVSGREDYQPDLLEVLRAFPGDKYGQVIGRSDQTTRFADGDYAEVFSQAKSLGLRYLEPWEYELKTGHFGANGQWDAVLADFNEWSVSAFIAPRVNSLELDDQVPVLRWSGAAGRYYCLESSSDLIEWDSLQRMRLGTASESEFRHESPTSESPQFYRVRLDDE